MENALDVPYYPMMQDLNVKLNQMRSRWSQQSAGPRSVGEWEWDDNVNVNGFISMGHSLIRHQ